MASEQMATKKTIGGNKTIPLKEGYDRIPGPPPLDTTSFDPPGKAGYDKIPPPPPPPPVDKVKPPPQKKGS